MKWTKWSLFALFAFAFTANLSAQARLAPRNDPNAAAHSGQSEIIINAENADRDIAVWVNGAIAAHVAPKSREKIIVPNGQITIEAADSTVNRQGQWNTGTKRQITFNLNSSVATIGMTTRYGALLSLSIQSTVALGGGTPAPAPAAPTVAPAPTRPPTTPPPARGEPTAAVDTIENAVYRAAWVIIENLENNATVAVLSISCPDPDLADFIIEELVYLMVDTKKFKVVDRRSLDAIQAEARFQYSGDVDDGTAVSIGKLLGASIVVTGSVSGTGSTRRLRAKALDVQTAEIVAMASERF